MQLKINYSSPGNCTDLYLHKPAGLTSSWKRWESSTHLSLLAALISLAPLGIAGRGVIAAVLVKCSQRAQDLHPCAFLLSSPALPGPMLGQGRRELSKAVRPQACFISQVCGGMGKAATIHFWFLHFGQGGLTGDVPGGTPCLFNQMQYAHSQVHSCQPSHPQNPAWEKHFLIRRQMTWRRCISATEHEV